jgi:hypothetical protein
MFAGENEPKRKKHRVENTLFHVAQKQHKGHFNVKRQVFQWH